MADIRLSEREYNAYRFYSLNVEYSRTYYSEFNFNLLSHITYLKRRGRSQNKNTVNNVIIMFDTETSKAYANATVIEKKKGREYLKYLPVTNHIVIWTISIRAYSQNLVTLYGRTPSELAECMELIHNAMQGDETAFYAHNLAYDWVFARKFLMKRFGKPEKQLNVKSHYPISIKFDNGIWLRDSLILAQRGLEKWASDMDVEHKKAVGSWDYDKIRNQNTDISDDELMYVEYDTLAGVECIDALCKELKKDISTIPYTATGIPREGVRKLAVENKFRDKFLKMALTFEQFIKMLKVFHGGYTHSNRHYVNELIIELVKCYDFASSYPYTLLAYKFPMSAFVPLDDVTVDDILRAMDEYAFMFKLIMIKPKLKNDYVQMPYLQFSKLDRSINATCDNGRVLIADYAEIYVNEYDLALLVEQYDFEAVYVTECEYAVKQYLPRWFTDYVYNSFVDKTMLKGGDPVAYAIAKALLNSLYGMCVQKPIKESLEEDYNTGDYKPVEENPEEMYEAYLKRRSSVLPYQWGVWVTSIAAYNVHQLGACCDLWLYTDTDSVYGVGWDDNKINEYNEACKERLKANGYGAVVRDGREYWLGVAEHDGDNDTYTEFRVQGAKRYAGRCKADDKVHITVAGVPKKGAKCLNDDMNNFKPGFIFSGLETNKKTHTYIYRDDIITDANGNEIGDSIDLTPCDYELDSIELYDWEELMKEYEYIQIFEEEEDG